MSVPVSQSNSYGQNLNQINSMQKDIESMKNVQVFKDDTGTRRVLGGRGSDGFYGFKVSKPGFDVYDTDDENLIFNSSQNTFKIAKTDTVEFEYDLSNTSNFITVTHGLGFVPVIIAYLDLGSTWIPLPAITSANEGPMPVEINTYIEVQQIGTTTFVVNMRHDNSQSGTGTFNVKYFALQESLA